VQMSQIGIATVAFRALLDSVEPEPKQNALNVPAIETNLVLRGSTGLSTDRTAPGKYQNHS